MRKSHVGRVVFFVIITIAAPAPALCDCLQNIASLQDTLRGEHLDQARSLTRKIETDASCNATQITAARKATAFSLVQAALTAGRKGQTQAYDALISEAAGYNALWQASRLQADSFVDKKRYADAASAYQNALELAAQEKGDLPAQEKASLLQRADEARGLAGTLGNGDGKGIYVPPATGHRGGLGGVYGDMAGRGLVAKKVPAPIEFEFNSTAFTPIGQKYADELVQVLKDRNPTSVTIVGHTDQSGSQAYNQTLSEQRAGAVAEYLERSGIKARFSILGKGKSEPRTLSSTEYSADAVMALNRRVELDWK